MATTTTDAQGRFSFLQDGVEPDSPYLIQAVFESINYRVAVSFDSTGNGSADLAVYEPATASPGLRIKSARIIIRAEGEKARVQEMFAVENAAQPPRTYVTP